MHLFTRSNRRPFAIILLLTFILPVFTISAASMDNLESSQIDTTATLNSPEFEKNDVSNAFQPNEGDNELLDAFHDATNFYFDEFKELNEINVVLDSYEKHQNWSYATIYFNQQNAGQLRFSFVILAQMTDGVWKALPPVTSQADTYNVWLDMLPEQLIASENKDVLVITPVLNPSSPETQQASTLSGYRLPWLGSAQVQCLGNQCNGFRYPSDTHTNQIDFDIYLGSNRNARGAVLAAKAGHVVYAKDSSNDESCSSLDCWRTANMLVIEHVVEGGYEYSWYVHLSHNSIPDHLQQFNNLSGEKGPWVEAGELIGQEGATGYSFIGGQVHLHFMVCTRNTEADFSERSQTDPGQAVWNTTSGINCVNQLVDFQTHNWNDLHPGTIVEAYVGDVRGRVTFSDGQPVQNAEVRIDFSGHITNTNSEGYYLFENIPSGTVIVYAERYGYDGLKEIEVIANTTNQANIVVFQNLCANYENVKTDNTAENCVDDSIPPSASGFSGSVSNGTAYFSPSGVSDAGGSGVREVRFSAKWDGQWRGVGVATSPPYNFAWEMCASGVPNGDVELGMEVHDNAGNIFVWSRDSGQPNPHITKNFNCEPEAGVYLYRDTGHGGLACRVTQSIASIGNHCGSGWNDAVRSIKIVGDWSAAVFSDDKYRGQISIFNGSDNDLNDDSIRYEASSVKVRSRTPALFTLHSLGDLNGDHFPSDRTIFDLGHWEFNDRTESISVASGYQVIVCDGADFHGTCGRTDRNVSDINAVAQGLRGAVSSVRVCQGSCPSTPNAPVLTNPSNNAIYSPGSEILLQWQGEGTQFRVEYWGGALGGNRIVSNWMNGTQLNIGALPKSDNPYHWKVQAWNEFGESGWTSHSSFYIQDLPATPNSPSSLSIENITVNSLTLAWQDESGDETGFNIYRYGNDGSGWDYIFHDTVPANTTTYIDESLFCSQQYVYKVSAFNENGESGLSSMASGVTDGCIDLYPYGPDGYNSPVVLSSVRDTTSSNTLYAGPNINTYLDWHFINGGDSIAPGTFFTDMFIDGERVIHFPQPDFSPGQVGGARDWIIDIDSPGWYTVRFVVDAEEDVDEINEYNNVWEQSFYWNPVNGWWGEYFNNETLSGNPVFVRDDPAIDFAWLGESPHPSVNPDSFSVRWTKTVDFVADTYLFTVVRDDGARLWIDDQKILDEWTVGVDTHQVLHTMSSGSHDIRLEVFEKSGWASAGLSWIRTCGDSAEPNNQRADATSIGYGESKNGRICPNDTDYFEFSGSGGDRVVIDIDASVNGSALDSYLELLDSNGAVIASNDDWKSTSDSTINIQLPSDDTYYIRVSGRGFASPGGTEHFYRLKLITDDTSPEVTTLSPQSGDYLSSNLTSVIATASDSGSGVNRIDLFIRHDGEWKVYGPGQRNGNEWIWSWDASAVNDQRLSFSLFAYDELGNVGYDNFSDVTLDRTKPSSAVNDLPDVTETTAFLVSWAGTDNLSGITKYDVQVRDGNGAWSNLLTNTTETSTTFNGQNGHTYYFRVRAHDAAGNIEAYPGGDGDTQTTVDITSTCTSLTLQVNPSTGGLVNADPAPNCDGGTKYTPGTVVELTADVFADFTFSHWSGGASGTNATVSVTMNEDKVVTANLTQTCYTLTVGSSPTAGGEVNVETPPNCGSGGLSYLSGTQVELTAVSNPGYEFDNWSGNASGSSENTAVVMNRNRSVTANFSEVTTCYRLNLSTSPNEGGTLTASPQPNCADGKYIAGTTVQLTAAAHAGYEFERFSGAVTGSDNPSTLTIDSFKAVTAHFVEVEGPELRIGEVTGYPNQKVEVPIYFTSNDAVVAATIFSLDFDATCLSMDETDANGDGLPDAVKFFLPADYNPSGSYLAIDVDGEIDINIIDTDPPLAILPDGKIMSVEFTATCQPTNPQFVEVNFAADPPYSFGGPGGKSILGSGLNGGVEIQPFVPGDCNSDSVVDAGDLSALALEIFDGDGESPANAANGTFAGGQGCDANADDTIDAGDITCTVLIIFDGPEACSVGTSSLNAQLNGINSVGSAGPMISLPEEIDVSSGDALTIPITFTSNGHEISSLAFSIDFDDAWLTFDPTDADGDGTPDAVTWNIPPLYGPSVNYQVDDVDGELDFILADISPPLQGLADGVVAYVTFTAGTPGENTEAPISFSTSPAPSFGNTLGQSVAGSISGGVVNIQTNFVIYIPFAGKP